MGRPMKPLTARHFARHGCRYQLQVRSPYTARWLPVVAARELGSHVEIVSEFGCTFLVDAGEKLERRRP